MIPINNKNSALNLFKAKALITARFKGVTLNILPVIENNGAMIAGFLGFFNTKILFKYLENLKIENIL